MKENSRYAGPVNACAIMLGSIMFISLYAVSFRKREYRRYRSLLFILLAAIPCKNMVSEVRGHIIAVFVCIASFVLVYAITGDETGGKRKKRLLVLFFVICLLGAIGDFLIVIEGIIPILLLALYRVIVEGSEKKKDYGIISALAGLSVLFSMLLDKLYFFIGKANKNSYVGTTKFEKFESLPQKTMDCFRALMDVSFANFTDHVIGGLGGIFNLIKVVFFIVLFVALLIKISILFGVVRKKADQTDDLSLLLRVHDTGGAKSGADP